MARRNPRPSTEILGIADLATAIPSWATFTRGAGSWTTQTAELADGVTSFTAGTSQNTPRHHYFSAAGRPMLLVEPARTNLVTASTITEVSVANRPDNWSSIAGVAGTDYDVIAGGPGGGNIFRILDTATANRGVSNTTTIAALTQYTWSAYTRRTVTAGAGSFFIHEDGAAGNVQIAANATLHDWLRETNTSTTGAGASALNYMCASGDPPGVTSYWGPQFEAGAYASTFVPSTVAAVSRAAELCAISSARIGATSGEVSFLWCPLWANDAFATVATLFTWGVGWRLDYDGADDKFKVVVNTTNRAESAAQTFAAGSLHRIKVRYGTFGQILTVDGVTTSNSTAWGSPTVAAYLGSRAASANCESAGYASLALVA